MLLRPLWDAGTGLVTGLCVAYAVGAVLPAATAVATAAVVAAAQRHGARPGTLAAVSVPLLLLGVVVTADHALRALTRPAEFLGAGRIDGAHRARVAALALGAPTIETLEQPAVQDLIRTTTADPGTWVEQRPSDGALAQLHRPFRYLGIAASAAVLAAYAWWLIPALVVPALLHRALDLRVTGRHYRVWQAQAPELRRFKYWGEVATGPAEGKELRVFGAGGWLVDRHQAHVRAYLDPVYADERRGNVDRAWGALLILVPLTVVYYLVAVGTAGGRVSIATETAVLTAAWSVYLVVIGAYDAVMTAGAVPVMEAYHQLRTHLAARPEPMAPAAPPEPMAPAAPPEPVAEGTAPLVRFDGVSFGYDGDSRLVLDGLDLEIRPGELLAIVGLNGAGKSTLVKLLAGLYAPSAGRITADGRDIADPAAGGLVGWRRRLAVVFQDFVRYHLSAEDNVRLGAAGPLDRAALDRAAREAGLAGLVEEWPAGWGTPLARDRSGGTDLSGGQWQQVVLARALYAVHRGARIMVLDEPTAHLDVRTELGVFTRLAAVRQRATVVLISHRLSTVRQADRIVLLDGGRVTESGDHTELMTLGGQYARMFAVQAERFTRGYDDRIGDDRIEDDRIEEDRIEEVAG